MPERSRLTLDLGANIRMLRRAAGLSLRGLAERSGLSKAALSQIEGGTGNPTLETLWSIALGLDQPFSRLLRVAEEPVEDALTVDEGSIRATLVETTRGPQPIDVFKMDLAPGARRDASGHRTGTVETVFVISGKLWVGDASQPKLLRSGESHRFAGHVPHLYVAEELTASAIVTLQYSGAGQDPQGRSLVIASPCDSEAWEAIGDLLERHRREVAQAADALRFTMPVTNSAEAAGIGTRLRTMIRSLQESGTDHGLQMVVESSESVSVHSFCFPAAPRSQICQDGSSLAGCVPVEVGRLEALAAAPPNLSEDGRGELARILGGPCLLRSALAAEVLTRAGESSVSPAVFRILRGESATKEGASGPESRTGPYACSAYELIRPAYARRTVWIAEFLLRHAGPTVREVAALESGPGWSLAMLLEILPELCVTALEPSPSAHAYLEASIGRDPRVRSLHANLLDLPDGGIFDAITATSASNRMDAAHFLEKTRRLLRDDGLLVVADEFIRPFSSRAEQEANLLRHHLGYVVATLVPVDRERLVGKARAFVELICNEVPRALFEVIDSDAAAAAHRCRLLVRKLRSLEPPVLSNEPLLAFYRFHLLELEALVAGLDSLSERKTCPDDFALLASTFGFREIDHCRLYPTDGSGHRDAGTHVFAFKAA